MKKLSIVFIFKLVFLINLNSFDNIEKVIENNHLYNSQVWKSLIHVSNNKPSINNKDFLLSFDNFSLKNELIETIKQFRNNKNSICKYPARYHFIKTNMPELNLETQKCKEFDNYLTMTDLDNIDLVYVSENVKNPSSILGHVFFKLNSKPSNTTRTNAISFYTVIDDLNIPLLIYESIIKGMKGYFVLKPYSKQIYNYINAEERNVWEYNLDLNSNDKKLIYYHFWELKDIDITYYFTKYNCATLVDEILSIAYQNDDYYNGFWTTPLDVIKKAKFNKVIKNGVMNPSLEWNLYMLERNITTKEKDLLTLLIDNNDYLGVVELLGNNSISYFGKRFINYYVRYKYLKLNEIDYKDFVKYLELFKIDDEDKINVSNYKNPINANKDSQISLKYSNSNNTNSLNLTLLLSGNTIYDADRLSFGESILQIGKIDLEIDNKLRIEEVNFYKMTSYLPITDVQKPISKEIDISFSKKDKLKLSAGFGASFLYFDDILNFNIIDVGIKTSSSLFSPFIKPKVGFLIYEILNLKTTIELSYNYYFNNDYTDKTNIEVTQSYTKKDLYRLDFSFKNEIMKNEKNKSAILNLTYFF